MYYLFLMFSVCDQEETNANATLDQYWFEFLHMNYEKRFVFFFLVSALNLGDRL